MSMERAAKAQEKMVKQLYLSVKVSMRHSCIIVSGGGGMSDM